MRKLWKNIQFWKTMANSNIEKYLQILQEIFKEHRTIKTSVQKSVQNVFCKKFCSLFPFVLAFPIKAKKSINPMTKRHSGSLLEDSCSRYKSPALSLKWGGMSLLEKSKILTVSDQYFLSYLQKNISGESQGLSPPPDGIGLIQKCWFRVGYLKGLDSQCSPLYFVLGWHKWHKSMCRGDC